MSLKLTTIYCKGTLRDVIPIGEDYTRACLMPIPERPGPSYYVPGKRPLHVAQFEGG